MSEKIFHKWEPISDLAEEVAVLAVPELRALTSIWEEQRDQLEKVDALHEFLGRLRRRLSIETGIIERVYSLDSGVTETLIEQGIHASLIPREATDKDPELVAAMISDHEAAIESLFAFVKGNRELSVGYVKELHAVLMRNQDTCRAVNGLGRAVEVQLLKGDFKKHPNNPTRPDGSIHEYCPPEQVASEMDRLISWHHDHSVRGLAPEVEAAWLHHRFTQIHPFQDGNGRVARCLANLITIKAGWFPLVITRDDRTRYIKALEAADAGNLKELVELFSASEKTAFVNALSVASDVLQREHVRQILDAAREDLLRGQDVLRAEWKRSEELAGKLQDRAEIRLQEVKKDIESRLRGVLEHCNIYVDQEMPDGAKGRYFWFQIVETAKRLNYFANTNTYRAWVRLVIGMHTREEILISFHGAGKVFRGILAVSACFFRMVDTSEEGRDIADLIPLSDEIFQINYKEDYPDAADRFDRWIEKVLVKGLEIWRRGLSST